MMKTSSRSKPPGTNSERHGLFMLYPSPDSEDIDMDIIFVHGLGGDAFQTWTVENNHMWPKDFVPQILPKARVMTFGYDSKWAFSPSTADINDFARDLLHRLRSKRWSAKAMQNPIVFICHSLGGIVCKEALVLAQSERYYTNIFEKTIAILFFGTPHRGSRVASWATVMANFINTCAFHHLLRKKLLVDLSLSSKLLSEISVSFKRIASNIKIWTFYETCMMAPLKGLVVEKDSASLGLPNEQRIPIAANHREMVHFTKIDGQDFDIVKSSLHELRDSLKTSLRELELGHVSEIGEYKGGQLDVAEYDKQLLMIPVHAPGTCKWLSLHPTFSDWFTSTSSELLWLRGYAGVGKSVITKYLITSVIGSNYVRSKRNSTPGQIDISDHEDFLIHFFCSESKSSLRSEKNILRSVLHQLLLAAPIEVAQALQIFKNNTTPEVILYKFLGSVSFLWDAIEAVLVALNWKVTYLIFDALDEMPLESLLTFINGLRDLIQTVSPQIMPRSLKVLITSRPSSHIEQVMSPPSISIKNERDVRHFIECRADDLCNRHQLSIQVRDQIVTNICEKAGGMFLWASLVWEELFQGVARKSQFVRNLKIAQNLPATLESLYENILARLDSQSLTLSLEAFSWLIAATRPMHSNELRFAVALDAGEGNYKTICDRMMSKNSLKTLCPHLIEVDEMGFVHFAHSSIRDFLLQSKDTEKYCFDLRATHAKLARLCLRSLYLPGINAQSIQTSLCSKEIRTQAEMRDLSADYYLLPYAWTNWHVHANTTGRSLEIWTAFEEFLTQTACVKLWLMLCLYDESVSAQVGWAINRNWWHSMHPPPPIHIAVFLKNIYFIEMLVQKGFNINALNKGWKNSYSQYCHPYLPQGGSVLHFNNLELDMTNHLIRLGADIRILDSDGKSPVGAAITQRNEDRARILIRSAQQNSQSSELKYGPGILHMAAAATMLSVVKIILDDDSLDLCNENLLRVDTSALGSYYTSPLEHACLYGMESVARIMMSHPRMKEAQLRKEVKYGKTNPTSLAMLTTLQGWSDLTLMAVQNFPVDLASEKDFDRRSILHHSCMEEWHDLLEICIVQFPVSKPNSQDKNGMTALHLAAKARNWYATGRLLEAGANSHMEDDRGRTVGHVATEAGSERVLRLLLDRGAISTGSLDCQRRTVLHYAATWNLISIVEALIEMDKNCVQVKDHHGRSPAHMAALFGSTATLSFMLSTSLIYINEADEYGRTLLHCAVESKTESCINELLSREDIELNPLDRYLKSPLDMTKSFVNPAQAEDIRRFLVSAGCRPGLWRERKIYDEDIEAEQQQFQPRSAPQKFLESEWALVLISG